MRLIPVQFRKVSMFFSSSSRRRAATFAAVAIAGVGGAAVALADDLGTDTDTLVAGNQHGVTLAATPGQELTFDAGLFVECRTRDHMAGSTTFTFDSVASIKPAGGALSATAVTIAKPSGWPADNTNCGSAGATSVAPSTISLTAPGTTGTYEYKVVFASSDPDVKVNGGDSQVVITLEVATPAPSDITPPVITKAVSGTTGANGWYTGPVTVTWSVVDDESAISSMTGCGVQNFTANTSAGTSNCSATSAGGTSTDSTTFKIDRNAPDVTGAATTAPNAAGWYLGPVTIDWTCSDAPSGLAGACPADGLISGEGSGLTTTSGDVADNAGNTANATSPAVNIDGTGPALDCDDDEGPTDWVNDNVTVTCTAGDAISGLAAATSDASFALSTSVADDGFDETAETGSRNVSDIAGNTSTAGVFTFKVDKQAPVAVCTGAASNVTDWFASNQSVSCAATDGGSGLTAAAAAFSLATNVAAGAETANASTGTKTVKDNVLNESNAVGPYTFNVDRKAPSVSCDRDSDATTWYADDQTVTCRTTDGGSGSLEADEEFTLTTNVPVTYAGTYSTGSHAAKDNVANTAATTGPFSFQVDKASPVVMPVCPETATLGQTISVSYSSTDQGSGVKTGTGTGSVSYLASTVGSQVVSIPAGVATDNVDNTSAATSCTTRVVYAFTGFFQPIDNGALNRVKAGSAIPVKFSLSGNQGLSIFAPGSPSSGEVTCGSSTPTDDIETLTSGTSGLKYDATADQYNYTWKTQTAWANTCRMLTVKLNDGTSKTALFKFTR